MLLTESAVSDGTYVKRLGPEYSYLELQDIMEDEDEMPMGEGPGKINALHLQ